MENVKALMVEMQQILIKTKGVKRYCEDSIFGAMGSKPIKIITGFRRSGKSFLSKQIALRLVNEGVYKLENIMYLNFEHYQLREFNDPESLDNVFKIFKRDIADTDAKLLLIFDEIQNVKNWDVFIRTIYEMYGEEIEIILTGSNSELLSSEIGSNLAGRFIEFELLPFSFKEYLKYFDVEIKNATDFLRKKEIIYRHFNQYRSTGGLPEICSVSDESAKYSYLQGIVSKVILDDIIERFKIKSPDTIEKILYFLNLNIGNIVSFTKLQSYLEKMNAAINSDTVISYVNSIIKTFTLFEVNRFDWKQGRIFETSKKFYSIDTGITNSFDHTTRNHSKLLENIVFLELCRRNVTVYFGGLKSGKEIDFVAKNRSGSNFDKYQVTEKLTEENKKREMESFLTEDEILKNGINYLLELDCEEEVINLKGNEITRKNLIKWLLNV